MALADSRPLILGRYALFDEIGSGGMASVHLGRLLGPGGFARTVAIKRMHSECAKDPDFVAMFVDEGRMAARVQHPNVVSTLDVVEADGALFLVTEYVEGESLSSLLRAASTRGEVVGHRVVASIIGGVLHGLQAAHDAKSERGEPLEMVHRDVSPQNILVGTDGVARVLDFGIAKALGRVQTTREGQVKGKLAYIAPEQLNGRPVSRQADVYSAGVVLWEALTGSRLFAGENDGETINRVLSAPVKAPSRVASGVPRALDPIVLRAIERDPELRFATAREMASALEAVIGIVPPSEVGAVVERLAAESLAQRAASVARIESDVIADPKRATPARRGPRQLVVPLGMLAAALVGLGLFAATRQPAAPIAPAPASAIREPAPLPSAAASSSAAVVTAPPPEAAPLSSVREPSPITSTAPPRRPAPVQVRSCDPPYYFEETGKKRYKPECM